MFPPISPIQMLLPLSLLLLHHVAIIECVSCYVGSITKNELVPCLDGNGYQIYGNATVVRPNATIPCCRRKIRGPEVELTCGDRIDTCSKDKCYDYNVERIDAIGLVGYKRSQECLCSGEGCNGGNGIGAHSLLVICPIAVVLGKTLM